MEEILKELWKRDKKHYQNEASRLKKKYKTEQTPQRCFVVDILIDKTYLSGYIKNKIESLGEDGIMEIINELEEK